MKRTEFENKLIPIPPKTNLIFIEKSYEDYSINVRFMFKFLENKTAYVYYKIDEDDFDKLFSIPTYEKLVSKIKIYIEGVENDI